MKPFLRSGRRSHSNGRLRWMALAITVVAAAVVVAVLATRSHEAPDSHSTPAQVLADGTTFRGSGELPSRPYRSVVAGAGGSMLITGSVVNSDESFSNPSFVYDVKTGGIREVAAPPFSPALSGVHTVAVPGAAVIVGTRCASAKTDGGDFSTPECDPGDLATARFDFDTDRWIALAPPKGLGFHRGDSGETGITVGWSGTQAVFQLGGPGTIVGYDPAESRWQAVPLPLPASPISPSLCADGDGVYAKYLIPPDTAPNPSFWKALSTGVNLFRWDEGAGWQQLPAPPLRTHDPLTDGIANDYQVLCGHDGILLHTSGMNDMWSWSSNDERWTQVTQPPFQRFVTGPEGQRQVVGFPNARAIGREYVFWGAQYPTRSGLAYNPDSKTWRETATGGIGSASQDGAAVLQGHVLALAARAPGELGVGSWAPTDFDGTLPQETPLTTETTTGA